MSIPGLGRNVKNLHASFNTRAEEDIRNQDAFGALYPAFFAQEVKRECTQSAAILQTVK
jgi:hypothetical protein